MSPADFKLNNVFLRQVLIWSWIGLGLSVLYQYLFWENLQNMVAIACVLLAWTAISTIYLKNSMLQSYPLSAFLLIGFSSTQFYFPLIFTSLEGKPLTFNLDMPFEVFFHSLAALMVLIIAHMVYRLFAKNPGYKENTLLIRVGLFTPPEPLQIWIMGIIGLGATFYVWLYSPNIAGTVTGSAFDKLVQGLIPFSYAPFFIPFGKMYGSRTSEIKKIALPLLAFSLCLFLVSLGRNSRGGFMIGFSSVGFAYALGLILGVFKTQLFTLKNGLIGVLLIWLMTGPVADIGTAMVLVRNNRSEISYSELISQTLIAYGDKEAIKNYRLNDKNAKVDKTDWNEVYVDNIIIARFSNLKFNDISLVQASRIEEKDPEMMRFTIDYVWATLPQPFLDALGVEIDKVMLKTVSFGDYLYYRAGAPAETLGGYRSGHMAGVGMAAFGWWYLLILGLGIIPVYALFDSFFRYKKIGWSPAGFIHRRQLQFSLCGMLALDINFRFLPAESVTTTIVFLLRDWIQLVILYLIVYYLTLGLVFMIGKVFPKPYSNHIYTT